MTNRQTVGNIGEELACKFIRSKGYKIIERNHRQKYGEIDIISIAPDKTLVFFEVKALSGNSAIAGLTPEDNLSRAKLQKLQRTASIYANNHLDLIDDDRGWQIDLIAISGVELTNNNKHCDIRHYENI